MGGSFERELRRLGEHSSDRRNSLTHQYLPLQREDSPTHGRAREPVTDSSRGCPLLFSCWFLEASPRLPTAVLCPPESGFECCGSCTRPVKLSLPSLDRSPSQPVTHSLHFHGTATHGLKALPAITVLHWPPK